MAADPVRLAQALRAYRQAVATHVARIDEQHQRLTKAHAGLRGGYTWQAAQEFNGHFLRTSQAFEEYVIGAKAVDRLLEERIEALDRLGRTAL